MEKKIYPTFGIKHLIADKIPNELLNVDRFDTYLKNNPHLGKVHGHSYFHIVCFTKGKGYHLLDFQKKPIKKGMIYFMLPSQVHKWEISENSDGYVLNFSPTFFDWLQINSVFLHQFPFFTGIDRQLQTHYLSEPALEKTIDLFEKMISILNSKQNYHHLSLANSMIELFIETANDMNFSPFISTEKTQYSKTIGKFYELVELHFKELKLPRNYAEILNITPNHLNTICKETAGYSTGTIIRNRILLEAQRLLVNFNLTISEIAFELNFQDVSYFVKFFKKQTGDTPETFRKNYYLD